jgi:hypothetical protein
MAKGKIYRYCKTQQRTVPAEQCKECPLECKNSGGRDLKYDRGGKDTTKGCKQF